MMVLFLVTGFITQFMSNNAAVALMTPIGIAIAQSIGIEPYGFVMACLFGSGIGCLTPMQRLFSLSLWTAAHYYPQRYFQVGSAGMPVHGHCGGNLCPAALDVTASLRKPASACPAEQAFLLSES